MDPQALAQAVTGAQYYQPQTALPTSPEVQAAFSPAFGAQQARGDIQSQEYNLNVTEANRKEALRQQAQRLQDQTDPSKYQVVRKDDGGYDFFDPEGNQIDIATYAQRTGLKPADIIKDSENPIDRQYYNDYNNLQKFIDAIVSKDRDTVEQFTATDPNLKSYVDKPGGVDELIRKFRESYRRYYVTRQQDPAAWGQRPSRVVVPTPQSDTLGLDESGGI